jgi:hypothetical protein
MYKSKMSRLVGHVAHRGKKINAKNVWQENLKVRDHL